MRRRIGHGTVWDGWLAGAVLAAFLPVAPLGGESPPAWIGKFPHDPGQYIGIGRGDKLLHPGQYREMAQAAALAQISREISIRLVTENSSAQSEDATGWRETYAQKTAASSRIELSGYRLADVYETAGEYWVCYSLDKEEFRHSLDEREIRFAAWLQREAAALHSELQARRIQQAMRRFAEIRRRYAASYPGDPQPGHRSAAVHARYAELTDTIAALSLESRLASAAPAWTLDFREGNRPEHPGWAEVSLRDGPSGEKWRGPFSLSIANRLIPAAGPCRVETEADGRMDLKRPFLECGLAPGTWRVTWEGAGNRDAWMEVRADLFKADVALAVSGEGAAAGGEFQARLAHELAGLNSPCYRIASGPTARSLEIRVRELAVDSLDGLYFTSLRGTVRFPGVPTTSEASGKSGHGDRERSLARALRDFARDVARISMSNPPSSRP